jgi:hypothetical protein
MNTPDWTDDELARAYEEKFEVLEHARNALDLAVWHALEAIQREVRASHGLEGTMPGEADGIAKYLLRYEVGVPNEVTRVVVTVQFSAPHGRAAGLLEVALNLKEDPKYRKHGRPATRLVKVREELRTKWGQRPEALKGWDGDWLFIETLALREGSLARRAAESVGRLISWAGEVSSALGFSYRVERLLEKCAQRVTSDVSLPFVLNFEEPGEFGKLAYQEVSPMDRALDFWVGFHVERETLMFGHHVSTDEFAAKMVAGMEAKFGAVGPELFEGYPSGTIMTAAKLHAATDEEIIAAIMGAYEVFARATGSLRAA